MDTQPAASPSPIAAPSTPAAAPLELFVTWPRCAQIALGALLAAGVLIIAGKSFLQSTQAGSSTLPAQRLDLNSAGPAELMLLPGVGEGLAGRIIAARAQHPFQTVDDLRQVPGIGPVKLERLRAWVFVAATPPHANTGRSLPLAVEPSKRPSAKGKKAMSLDGPIDINAADAGELMRLPGIGPKLSERIVTARAEMPYQTVADLRRVKGIGPKILEKIRPFIVVRYNSQ